MISAIQAYLDAVDAGAVDVASSWLDHIPDWQLDIRFAEYAAVCVNHIGIPLELRPANALNLEIGAALPRCRVRTPSNWGRGASSMRWLASGGSPLVLGTCSCTPCPMRRAPGGSK